MITPITATFPALNFPKESDYPTQKDWAAFGAAAELNYGILSGEWSDKSEEFKAQTNNLALEIQTIGENAINAITFDNIAQLKLNSNMGRVDVLGYYTKGDGGGGTFYWDSTSTEADNGGTIIQATGIITGRWKRVFSGAVNVKWFGAKGDGITDDTAAIQLALNYAVSIKFSLYAPSGIYIISQRIYNQVSGARLTFVGDGYYNTIFKASATFTDSEMFWFGNNTGHGVYGLNLRDIGIDGYSKNNNLTGIVAQENGLSHFMNIRIRNCGTAAICDGSIHMMWDGHNEITACKFGIRYKRIPSGTPSGLFDISVTSSPIALSTNISGIFNTWFGGCDDGAILMEGGLVTVQNCVFQSPANNPNKSVVVFNNCNESYDYGGGCRFINNWIEGGTYKYWVEVINTINPVLTDNFFSGSGANTEGGFLLHSRTKDFIIERNSFRGVISATPTEGRHRNASVYLKADSSIQFAFTYRDNYLTKGGMSNQQFVIDNASLNGVTDWRYCTYKDVNGGSPIVYTGGVAQSYYPSSDIHASGTITYSGGVPTIATSFNVNLIVDSGVGYLTIQYGRAKENVYQPFTTSVSNESTGTPVSIGTMRSSTAIDRVRVYTNGTSTPVDPDSISFITMGGTL